MKKNLVRVTFLSNGLMPILFACICLFLSSCAAVPTVTSARSLDQFKSEPKGDALIVLSVVVNTSEVSQISYLRLQKLDAPLKKGKPDPAPPEYTLSPVNAGKSGDISLLIGSVPAGRYRVMQIDFGMKYLTLINNKGLSEIEVKANESYDLGTVILTAANTHVLVGRSHLFPNNQWLINRYQLNNATLSAAHTGGWVDSLDSKEPVAEYFALSHPQGIGTLVESANGEIVAGSRMGNIIARNSSGKWSIIGRADTFDRVTLVVPNPASAQTSNLAFTENGDAYLVEKNTVKKISTGNLPAGKVIFLKTNAQATRWFAVVNHDNKSDVLTANALDGKWESVYSESIEFSVWNGARNAWVAPLPNGFIFASTTSPDLRCYDFGSEKWTTVPIPKKRVLLDIKTNPATGVIGILTGPGGGFGGIFATPQIASSCTSNWTEIKNPYKVQVAAPIPLNDSSIAVLGGVFGDTGMYISKDEGKTWAKQTSEIVLVDHLYQTKNNGLFQVSSGINGFEVVKQSSDQGATWTTELSSYDSRLDK